MKLDRLRFSVLQNLFCKHFRIASPAKLQPKSASRGFCISAAALLVVGFASVLAPGALRGATLGALTVAPTGASFGSVAVGTKNSQTIQLKNTGGTMLVLSSATLSGTGFSMTNLRLPLSLESSATVNLTVNFAPATTGGATGVITIKSNGSDPTLTIPVGGTGVTATRLLSLSTSSLSFGNETTGRESTLEVSVKNTGNSSVTVSGVSVTGAGFGIGGGFIGATIAAGQSSHLSVMFAPKTTGSVTGKISITSNASDSPNSISVSGTGVSNASHSVALSWTASTTSGVTGYYVYRSTASGSSYSRINSSPTGATKYTDGSVLAGETYYYVVTAVNASGVESAHSSQVEATIP